MEFARSHRELLVKGTAATRSDTRLFNRIVLFLESSSLLWEATKFIAEVRDALNLTTIDLSIETPSELASIFGACRNSGDPPKDSVALRMLHRIRHHASSHVTEAVANYAINCKFNEIKSEPLVRSRDGGAMTTTFPLSTQAAMLYCFQDSADDAERTVQFEEVIRTSDNICEILNIMQTWLGESFKDRLDTGDLHLKL